MLVLSRKPDEAIMVGTSTKITVLGVRPDGQIQIGIDAPDDVPIHRLEVFQDMMARDGRVTPGGNLSRFGNRYNEPAEVVRPSDVVRGRPVADETRTPVAQRTVRGPIGRPSVIAPRAAGVRTGMDRRDGGDRGDYGYPGGMNGGGK